MPRRLLPLSALVLVALVGTGCADDAAFAARVGDSIEITQDELLDEVAEWAASPALLEQVGITDPEGAAPGSYGSPLVDVVLTNRIQFDLHREQFDALGLTVDDTSRASLEEQLGEVLSELSPAFGERLVDDLVHVGAVSQAMGEGYSAWFAEATRGAVEVNPRFGSWDQQAGAVLPPEGARPAPATDQPVGL